MWMNTSFIGWLNPKKYPKSTWEFQMSAEGGAKIAKPIDNSNACMVYGTWIILIMDIDEVYNHTLYHIVVSYVQGHPWIPAVPEETSR